MNIETINPAETHAFLEQIDIPAGHSFLLRVDDYPWKRNVWNYHPEFEIHLIRYTSGVSYVGDHIGHFEPGYLCMVGSNLPHNWITPDIGGRLLTARDIVLQFNPDLFLNNAEGFGELRKIKELFDKAKYGIEFTGETRKIGRHILESMDGSGSLLDFAKLLELLSTLSQSEDAELLASEAFVLSDNVKGIKEHKVIQIALDHLQQNFVDSPSLKDVAELVGMSESAFSRFFKNKTGNTFSEHMSSLKLWMASKLLLETDTPISDICFEAGFNNIANFNRTFMRKNGMTPSKYRFASRQRNLSCDQEKYLP